ncbi:MAG: TRAP transporter substrate-binding protein DctP [Gammaproteobacteria bacterium]
MTSTLSIRVALLFSLAIVLASFAAHADMTFKIATIAPDGTRWMTEMRAAAKEIKQQTEGRVSFKFYPGGVMGNDRSVMRKIRIGQLHGSVFTGGGLADVYPDIRIYGLPMLFANLDEVDYVRERMDEVFEKGMEEAGFINFGFAEGGFALLMCQKVIKSSADLQDEKAWIPEGDIVAYAGIKALGVSPVVLPITDVLTGLQTGLVSTVAASALAAVAFQWHTRVKYVTDVPISYLLGIFTIDKRAFNRVDAGDQAIVRDVLSDVFDRLNALNRADDEAARQALMEQGIKFVVPPDEVIAEWRATSQQVIDKMGKEGAYNLELANKILDLIMEYRQQKIAAQGE